MANEIRGVRVNGTLYKVDYGGLANQPFGVETRETYVAEQEISFARSVNDDCYYSEDEIEISGRLLPMIGETYIVTWDGTEYECVCTLSERNYYLTLGDPDLLETPFFFCYGSYGGIYMYAQTTAQGGMHTIRVEHLTRSRIRPDCLPEYLLYGREKRTTVLEEQTGAENGDVFFPSVMPSAGDNCVVTFDGTEYRFVPEEIWDGQFLVGNGSYTDCPFQIVFSTEADRGGITLNLPSDDSGTHTIKIEKSTHGRMAFEYMPTIYCETGEVTLVEALNALSEAVNAGITFDTKPIEFIS